MKKVLVRALQIVLVLLIIFLVLSTFFPQISQLPNRAKNVSPIVSFFKLNDFYNSTINLVLWVVLGINLILVALTGVVKGTAKKIVHIVLALSFLVVIYEKNANDRFYMQIREQETVEFTDYLDTTESDFELSIHLEQFEIERHAGSRMPSAFISHLVLNASDTVKLAVNKPLKYRHYRFYQNAYDRKFVCTVKYDKRQFTTTVGDTLGIQQDTLIIANFDHQNRRFNLVYNGDKFQAAPNQVVNIADHNVQLIPQGTRFISIIEVAEVKGVGLLLILSMMYLLFLLIADREGGQQ